MLANAVYSDDKLSKSMFISNFLTFLNYISNAIPYYGNKFKPMNLFKGYTNTYFQNNKAYLTKPQFFPKTSSLEQCF